MISQAPPPPPPRNAIPLSSQDVRFSGGPPHNMQQQIGHLHPHQGYHLHPPTLMQHSQPAQQKAGPALPQGPPLSGLAASPPLSGPAMFGSFDNGMFEELNKTSPRQPQPQVVDLDPGLPKPWRPSECRVEGYGLEAFV